MFNKKTKPKTESKPESPVIRRRRIKEAREIWLDLFSSAITSLLGQFLEEEENAHGQHDWEKVASRLAKEAATIADAALNETEERFPGL